MSSVTQSGPGRAEEDRPDGVPVIKIGGKWIVGFDKPAIERELTRS
jgi:hypothetical protein